MTRLGLSPKPYLDDRADLTTADIISVRSRSRGLSEKVFFQRCSGHLIESSDGMAFISAVRAVLQYRTLVHVLAGRLGD